jgi:ATP adenylyltransferase
MPKPLWAPWRLEYIQRADEQEGCVFCLEAAGELPDADSLLVGRGQAAFAILNKFPYSSGH